jgi:hypothetical protein
MCYNTKVMAKRLTDLKVHEISLVPKGANGKRIHLTKSAETQPTTDTGSKEMEEEIAKSLEDLRKTAEAQRAELESLRKSADEAVQKQLELQKQLADEREAVAVRDAIAKHAERFPNIPGKADELAPALRTLAKVAPEAHEVLCKALDAANALCARATEPVGKADAPEAPGTAAEELAEVVKALRKEDPTLTEAQAIVKAYEQREDLYAALNGEVE